MSNYPELEAAAAHAEKVMPMFVAEIVADYLLIDDPNMVAGLRMIADEIMEMMPLATITETEAARDEVTNRFLDLYNANSKNLDRILELETALRERTRERDERQTRIEKALDMLGTETVVQANGEDIRTALKGG